jgi:predicted ester cyclase
VRCIISSVAKLHECTGVHLSSPVSGTFENDFFGIPATGKKAAWKGVNIYRFESGKIVEALWHKDTFTMLQQLGVIPTE